MRRFKIPSFSNTILLIIVYIMSGSVYMTTVPRIRYVSFIGVFIIYYCLLKRNRSLLISKYGLIVIFITIGSLFSFIIHEDSIMGYLSLSCTFIFSYGLSVKIDFNKFISIYQRFIIIVSLAGLVLYWLLQLYGDLPLLFQMKNSNGVVYNIGIIFNYIVVVPVRNCSVFWEPGLYATALIVALIFEIEFSKKISLIRIILFHICMFTTYSSAGIILLLMCDLLLLNRFFIYIFKYKLTRYILFGFIFLILVFIFFNSDKILSFLGMDRNLYYKKLLSGNFLESSRIHAFSNNISLFAISPLFGVGISNAYQNALQVADTSTTTFMMAEIGIIGLFPTIVLIYSIWKNHFDISEKCVLSFCFLAIINKEPHMSIVLIWIIMFYLLRFNRNEKSK